jgi:hypothetical protein
VVTASLKPAIANETTEAFCAFELTCSVDVNGPSVVGSKATRTVQKSAGEMAGDPEPQGFAPAFSVNANGGPDGVSKAIDDTFNVAVPMFVMVTSSGAGALPGVTLPKSKVVAGKTCIDGLPVGGGGGGEPPPDPEAGVGLPPPELHPTVVMASAVKTVAKRNERSIVSTPAL